MVYCSYSLNVMFIFLLYLDRNSSVEKRKILFSFLFPGKQLNSALIVKQYTLQRGEFLMGSTSERIPIEGDFRNMN